jgi:hypothetical protein
MEEMFEMVRSVDGIERKFCEGAFVRKQDDSIKELSTPKEWVKG